MKIQLISDLHYDRLKKPDQEVIVGKIINPEADLVILAGDIAETEHLHAFFKKFNETGKRAIYVPGNHDHWGKHVTVIKPWLKDVVGSYGHTILLNDFVVIEDVVFIGGTLWTNISNPIDANAVQMWMRDFKYIRGMGKYWWHNEHLNTIRYIEEALKMESFKNLKKIVVTHHSPSFQACPERFKFDAANCAFHSNQDALLNSEWAPDIWMHGHVHDACDMVVGKTRLIRNPFGYVAYGEKDTGFKQEFLIDTNDPNSYMHPDQQSGRAEIVKDSEGLPSEVPSVQS